jgi:hypothetical protein
MKNSCMRSAALLAFFMLASRIWAQNPVITIDPAGEHSRVYLSYMDADAQKSFSSAFRTPMLLDQKPYSLLLTNASGKAIVALSIRWTGVLTDETDFYDSSIDSLMPGGSTGSAAKMRLPGQPRPTTPVSIGQSHTSTQGKEVAGIGERMLVAPGLFIRESLGRPGGGSGMPEALKKAQMVSATLDTVVLDDGEVLGPDASHMIDSLRARKGVIDMTLNAVRNAEQNGQDPVELLKQLANAPLRFENGQEAVQLRMFAHSLMGSPDWRNQLESYSKIQLPNFHR